MDMRDKKVTFIVQAAVIAALYVVLTFVANALGLASHTIQVRFSEALYPACFYAGSDSGTVDWLSACESADRRRDL
jgi:uncharacterized membrane protein